MPKSSFQLKLNNVNDDDDDAAFVPAKAFRTAVPSHNQNKNINHKKKRNRSSSFTNQSGRISYLKQATTKSTASGDKTKMLDLSKLKNNEIKEPYIGNYHIQQIHGNQRQDQQSEREQERQNDCGMSRSVLPEQIGFDNASKNDRDFHEPLQVLKNNAAVRGNENGEGLLKILKGENMSRVADIEDEHLDFCENQPRALPCATILQLPASSPFRSTQTYNSTLEDFDIGLALSSSLYPNYGADPSPKAMTNRFLRKRSRKTHLLPTNTTSILCAQEAKRLAGERVHGLLFHKISVTATTTPIISQKAKEKKFSFPPTRLFEKHNYTSRHSSSASLRTDTKSIKLWNAVDGRTLLPFNLR